MAEDADVGLRAREDEISRIAVHILSSSRAKRLMGCELLADLTSDGGACGRGVPFRCEKE